MRDDPSDIALAAPPGWRAAVAKRECLRAAWAVRWHDHEGLPAGDLIPFDPSATVTGHEAAVAGRNASLRAALAGLSQRRSPHLVAVMGDPAGDDIEVKEPRGEQGD
jgi:hypothetical protein